MKISRILIGLTVLTLVLSGCAAKSQESPRTENDMGYIAGAPAESPMVMEEFSADDKTGGSTGAVAEYQQMVIMNADLSIAVDDPTKTMSDIQKLAADMGGFTVSSNLYKTQTASGLEVPAANITVRVPAERLNEALEKIKAFTGDAAKFTLSENISGQDVTQEYTDLKSRLRNLEEADAKLSEFYENAEKTEDALAIYAQKMQVTEQIEVIKGQMQYYEQSAAKSAISVYIQAKASVAPITVAGWQPKGVARKAIQALINFGKGLVNVLIWLGLTIIPILLIIGLPIYFLVRWLVRRGRKSQGQRSQVVAQPKPHEPAQGGKPPLPPI